MVGHVNLRYIITSNFIFYKFNKFTIHSSDTFIQFLPKNYIPSLNDDVPLSGDNECRTRDHLLQQISYIFIIHFVYIEKPQTSHIITQE